MIFSANLRATGLLLLGDEHQAHAPLADLFHQLVRADERAGPLGDRRVAGGRVNGGRPVHERAGLAQVRQQGLNLGSQARVAAAGSVEVGGALCRGIDL